MADAEPDDVTDHYLVAVGMGLSLDARGSQDPNEEIGDPISVFEWDLDEDGIYGIEGATPSLDFAALDSHGMGIPGLFPVTLRVTDLEGAHTEATTSVLVIDLILDTNSGSVNGGNMITLTSVGISLVTDLTTIFFDDVAIPGFAFLGSKTVEFSVPPGQVLARAVDGRRENRSGTAEERRRRMRPRIQVAIEVPILTESLI